MPRKIGIVGGIGWRSTVDYYAAIHELAAEDVAAFGSIELAIESLDLATAASLLHDGERHGRWAGFDNYHRAALIRLEASEAEIAAIACNTPHERLPHIRRGTCIDLVDLFDAIAAEADRQKTRRLLILGTITTMRSQRLRTLLAVRGIRTLVPPETVVTALQELIGELQVKPDSGAHRRLLSIVRECGIEPGSDDAVALQCTELPLAFPQPCRAAVFECDGVRFLNASSIHVRAVLRKARDVRLPNFAAAPSAHAPSSTSKGH